MTVLFVFALPFIIYGVAYGCYCLGRSLAQLAPTLWLRLCQKKEDR